MWTAKNAFATKVAQRKAIFSGDTAGGGLGGTYPNPTVTPAAGLDSTAIHSGDAAGGGLSGTYPNPTVTAPDLASVVTGNSTIAANTVRTIGGLYTIAAGGALTIAANGRLWLV